MPEARHSFAEPMLPPRDGHSPHSSDSGGGPLPVSHAPASCAAHHQALGSGGGGGGGGGNKYQQDSQQQQQQQQQQQLLAGGAACAGAASTGERTLQHKDLCALHMPPDPDDDSDCASLPRFRFSWRVLLKFMGPGLLMSIAYVDPGNLESCLQTGAQTGYVLLWVTLTAITMGFLVQMQAAKLGVATGQHLAEHCRQEYPPAPRYLLWIMAEIAIIGSDIQEVIGSALALVILSGGGIPIWAGVLITAGDCFVLLLVDRLGFRFLEAIFAVCIAIMSAAFGYMYVMAGVPQAEVAKGFVIPRMPAAAIPTAVAMVGALIMPHNIYLHSALVQSRNVKGSSRRVKRDAINYIGIESAISLLLAVFINLFVIAVFAKGFYGTDEASDVGLFSAGDYIAEKYGASVKYIWAVGLLAAGQSSTMTGTYTGQFVMTGYLNLRIAAWKRVIITRSVAIVPTLLVAISFGSSNAALDQLCQGLNLLQSVQLPFALIPVLTMCGSSRIMGAFVNSAVSKTVQWGISAFIILVNIFAIMQSALPLLVGRPGLTAVFVLLCVAYFGFLLYLIVNPWRWQQGWQSLRRRFPPSGKAGEATSPGEDHHGPSTLDGGTRSNLEPQSTCGSSAALLPHPEQQQQQQQQQQRDVLGSGDLGRGDDDDPCDVPPPRFVTLAAAAVADEVALTEMGRLVRQ